MGGKKPRKNKQDVSEPASDKNDEDVLDVQGMINTLKKNSDPKRTIRRVVRVEGLTSRTDLNGRVGRVETSARDGRVGVVFYENDGTILNTKPTAVKLVNLIDCERRPGQDIPMSQAWFDGKAEGMMHMMSRSTDHFLKTGEMKPPTPMSMS